MGVVPSTPFLPGAPSGGIPGAATAASPEEEFLDALAQILALKVLQGLGDRRRGDPEAYRRSVAAAIGERLRAASERAGQSAVTIREGGGTVMESGLSGLIDSFLSSQPVAPASTAAKAGAAATGLELMLGTSIEHWVTAVALTPAAAPPAPGDPATEESDDEPAAPPSAPSRGILIPDWQQLAPDAYRLATRRWEDWYERHYGSPDPRFLPPLGRGPTKIGAWVEEQIRILYAAQYPSHVVLSDTLLYPGDPGDKGPRNWKPLKDVDLDGLKTREARAIVAALVNPRTNRRRQPDLCDFTTRETYEIKPFGALTKGLKQLVEVLWLLDLRYFAFDDVVTPWTAKELAKKLGRTIEALDVTTRSFVHAFDLGGNPGQDPARTPFWRPGIWHPALEVIYPELDRNGEGLRILATLTVPGVIGYGRASRWEPVERLRRLLQDIIAELAAQLIGDLANALTDALKSERGGGKGAPPSLPPGSPPAHIPEPKEAETELPTTSLGLGVVRGALVESLREQHAETIGQLALRLVRWWYENVVWDPILDPKEMAAALHQPASREPTVEAPFFPEANPYGPGFAGELEGIDQGILLRQSLLRQAGILVEPVVVEPVVVP
jgi:hypothetical protein